jgi:archaellum component FlaC
MSYNKIMPELSKQDVKEVFTETLEPFAGAVQDDFNKVNNRLDKVDSRLDKVDSRLDKVDSRLAKVEFELAEVKTDVKYMKENFGELFTKLDKFIVLYEKQEQELLILGTQLRRLEERVTKLEAKQQ